MSTGYKGHNIITASFLKGWVVWKMTLITPHEAHTSLLTNNWLLPHRKSVTCTRWGDSLKNCYNAPHAAAHSIILYWVSAKHLRRPRTEDSVSSEDDALAQAQYPILFKLWRCVKLHLTSIKICFFFSLSKLPIASHLTVFFEKKKWAKLLCCAAATKHFHTFIPTISSVKLRRPKWTIWLVSVRSLEREPAGSSRRLHSVSHVRFYQPRYCCHLC